MSEEKQQINVKTEARSRRQSNRSAFTNHSFRSTCSQANETESIDSNAEDNSGKLEEDVRFPMEQHLMESGSGFRIQELDAMKALMPQYPETCNSADRFTLVTGVCDDAVVASCLSSLIIKNKSLTSLIDGSSGIWWLDCHNPSESEIRALARTFEIHPLTTDDIITQDSLEKFEMFQNYAFIAYKTFYTNPETNELEPVRFYLAVFRGGVLSFQSGHKVAHSDRVRTRMRQLKDWVKVSPIWICYALLDDITDSFEPVLSAIESEAAFVEHAVFVDNGTSEIAILLGRLGQARQKTMALVRLLYGKPEVIKGFINCANARRNKVVSSDIGLYLGDIRNRLDSMKENLLSYESILSRSHNSFMGILQVEYVNSNTRMTTLLGKVTIIGTILVPINLVFGAWGMNVPVPGQNSTGLGWFFGIVGTTCFIVVGIFIMCWLYFSKALKTTRSSSFV